MAESLKVAVIGAGTAGLVAARELLREGHQVTVFEKNNKVGGTWVYDPRIETDPLGLDPTREIIHSSLYRSLRTNLPRQIMNFLDYPFSKKEGGDPRSFPGHEEVLRYLEEFARDFQLLELIRFGKEVIRVEPLDGSSQNWIIEWKNREIPSGDKSEPEEELFNAVVVCNGHNTEPKIAQFPGINVWPGQQIHSHNYRTPEPFQNQIVVIIGKGTSAIDILKNISPLAREVHQVVRGVDFGLKKQENYDNVWQHPMIECAHEDGKVVFQDGSSVYADAIIHCTGYKYHFPFLKTNGKVRVDDNRVGPLYKHIFPPSLAPGLSFIGLPILTVPALQGELQAKWVARVLSGKLKLPTEEEMTSCVQEFYKHMEQAGLPKHRTHWLLQENLEYENWFVTQLGMPPLEKWREQLILLIKKSALTFSTSTYNYQDEWDVDKWIQEVERSH
ncbi:hypothetical protein SLE2022_178050 [Rubroshorea leprosula]